MSHTHSPAEWAQMGCLGLGVYGAFSVVYFLLVDADGTDLDPRPVARRALVVAHQAAVDAGHDLNRAVATSQRVSRDALRDAALTVAALLALLTITPEHTR